MNAALRFQITINVRAADKKSNGVDKGVDLIRMLGPETPRQKRLSQFFLIGQITAVKQKSVGDAAVFKN